MHTAVIVFVIGSKKRRNTVGTDNLTINDIGKLSADDVVEKVRKIVFGSKDWGYRPRPVRRKAP